MKVKLLKKVRKRFEIIHLPQGFVFEGDHYNCNLFKLVDNNKDICYKEIYVQLGRKPTGNQCCGNEEIFNTEIECINYLKFKIIRRLRSEGYRQRKDKTIEKVQKKVWYI
jgi:hypothetical protein